MATFSYRCPVDGDLDVVRPVGSAGAATTCPVCGGDAVRVYTAPLLSRGSSSARALIERTESTRERPEVVSAPPQRRRSAAPRAVNPAWSRLPRP